MKKNLLLLIILPLLISCSQDSIDEIPESKKAILFSELNDRVTPSVKAANENGSNYKIYAITSLNANQWYINDEVAGTGATENMPMHGPYYWLQNGTMDFFAYAPASSSSNDTYKFSGTFPNITITYTVPPKADEDFTVATPIRGINYNNANNTAVGLQFQHMLSKVSTEVELSQDLIDAGYSISNRGTTNLSVVLNSYKITITNGANWDTGFQAGNGVTYLGGNSYYILPQVGYGTKIQLMGVIISKGDKEVFKGGLTPYTLLGPETENTSLYYLDPGESHVLKFTINNMSTTKEGTEYIIAKDIRFSAAIADGWSSGNKINL